MRLRPPKGRVPPRHQRTSGGHSRYAHTLYVILTELALPLPYNNILTILTLLYEMMYNHMIYDARMSNVGAYLAQGAGDVPIDMSFGFYSCVMCLTRK